MKLSRIIAAGVMTLCLPALAEAQNYNQLVAFGGSTTDTGWYANAKLSPVPNVFDVGVASAAVSCHFPVACYP